MMCSTTKQMALVGKLYKLIEKLYEERGMNDLFFEHSVQYENHLALLFPIRDSYPGKF